MAAYASASQQIFPDGDGATGRTASAESCKQSTPKFEVTSEALEAAFRRLHADLVSGVLTNGQKRRAHYIAFAKAFHPDRVPPAMQKHACMRLAEINRLFAQIDQAMRVDAHDPRTP